MTATIPRIPQKVIDKILDHLATVSDLQSLRACALISRSWVQSCRRHLFHTITFGSRDVDRWFKTFPVPEESPAHYVRDLSIRIGWDDRVPDNFFEYVPRFTDVDQLHLLGHMAPPSSLRPSLWKLPQSITSLTINTSVVTLVQVRDIMAQLPNLDNLTLMGTLVAVDRRELLGIGTVLRGRYGGKLKLCGGYVDKDFTDMFLDIPSGPRFTEAVIHRTCEDLPSAVRIAEACCKTLEKLSYPVMFKSESDPFSQPNEISIRRR